MADRPHTPRRRWPARLLVALALLAWAGAITVAAVAVRNEPARSALDTQLEGVDEPETALQPTTGPSTTTGTQRPSGPPTERPCWPVYGRTAARTSDAADLRHGPPARRTWRRRIGIMEFPPSYCDGILYVNNQRGETMAIQARTGRVRWRRTTARVYDSTPAISGQRLFVGSFDPGDVQALDRRTGRRLWRLTTGGAVESSPVAVDGLVYATSKDRRVYAIEEATGRVRWAFRTGGEVKDSPSVWAGRVYVGNYAAEVFALDARTGRVRWRRALGGVRGDRIYSSVPIVDGVAYLATVRGSIYALDARTGATRWQREIPGYVYSTPAVSRGRLYIGNYVGQVHAFDARTGASAWMRTVGGTISGSPTVVGDLVYVSSLSRGRTWALSVRDGRTRWEHDEGRYVSGIATSDALYLSMGSHLSRWTTRPAVPPRG
jgi:outer membrane protein assembly factor BamB